MKDIQQLHISRQLSTLIDSGLPLLDAIKLMRFESVEKYLKQGQSLSFAFEKLGFHSFCIGLIKTGEASGNLKDSLNQINQFLDKKIKLKKKISKALHYPIIVLSISLMVLFAMFQWVIPSFETMFKNFQAELPLPTQILIKTSHWVSHYFLYILVIIFICIFIFYKFWQHNVLFQKMIDQAFLKIPVFGGIRKAMLVIQWARNIGILYSNGIPILDALKTTALNSNDWVTLDLCSKIKILLSQGRSFSDALKIIDKHHRLINEEYFQLIKIGENSGELGKLLLSIAQQEEEKLDQLVDQLTQSLEPVLMLFMGIIIGGLVISLYLPIFEMGQIL
jgi:type IV pilus assembly protein PilC